MSDDFLESIWSQFAVETDEHLEVMERILVMAERESVSVDQISSLFRSFHSVKGLCKALDLLVMEKLAHRAEDLLGLVREGVTELDGRTASLLLESVDELKSMRERAITDWTDGGEAPQLLLDRLATAYAEATAQPSGTGESAAEPESSDGSQGVALHEDPEMLEFFMEVLRENIPLLAVLLREEMAALTADEYAQIGDAIGTIARAADAMGFSRIKDVLEEIRVGMPENVADFTTEQWVQVVKQLPQFQDQIVYLEQETGQDAGSSVLRDGLADSIRHDIDRVFDDVLLDLDGLSASHTGGEVLLQDREGVQSVGRNIAAASSLFYALLPDSSCDSLLLLDDIYGRAASGELNILSGIIDLTREAVVRVQQLCRSTSAADTQDVLGLCEDLSKRIRDYVWLAEPGDAEINPHDAFLKYVNDLKINRELVEILSPENVNELMEAVNAGQHMYEVLAHLESSDEVAEGFLNWVGTHGKVITNRSIFIDGKSWYEMLLVSEEGFEEVQNALREIDPNENMIELKTQNQKVEQAKPKARKPETENSGGGAVVASSSNVIRVAGETLDSFMNQIGEMVLLRAQLNYAINNDENHDALTVLKELAGNFHAAKGNLEADNKLFNIFEAFELQHRKLIEVDALIQSALLRLQESAMSLRVVSMETVFKRFPRLVRDLAQLQGKRIRLEQSGQEVKIDKAMVEELSDPLMHMIRNSADHGIESPAERKAVGKPEEASIHINAIQRGGRVLVQVSDDGRGIDVEKVRRKAVERGLIKAEESRQLSRDDVYNYLFVPGFSTAEKVTETSGRGVGLDVVRNNVMRLGGSIHIKSEVGKGSTFTLEMPLSAAVQEVMLISVNGQTLAVPARYVNEVVEIENAEVQSIKGREAVLLRGAFLPLVYMGDLLGFAGDNARSARYRSAVVISNGQQMIGVEVDHIVGRRELFVKDIHHRLAALPGVGGASILGDGKVVLILDGEAILRLAERISTRRHVAAVTQLPSDSMLETV